MFVCSVVYHLYQSFSSDLWSYNNNNNNVTVTVGLVDYSSS